MRVNTAVQKKLSVILKSETKFKKLCDALETTPKYLSSHIYYGRRVPRKEFMMRLKDQLKLTQKDIFEHFYSSDD